MTDLSLDEAIAQLISLGWGDPLDIARQLESRHGDEWGRAQGAMNWQDLSVDKARRQLGALRRSAEVALRPGDEVSSAELRIQKAWIPGPAGGQWKRASDLTVDDLIARATWYERFANASLRRAMWCREVADLMESEGAVTLGKLKASLPALPDDEDLELGTAA